MSTETVESLQGWQLRESDEDVVVAISGWGDKLPCLHRAVRERNDGTLGPCHSHPASDHPVLTVSVYPFDMVGLMWLGEQTRAQTDSPRVVYFCQLCMIEPVRS